MSPAGRPRGSEWFPALRLVVSCVLRVRGTEARGLARNLSRNGFSVQIPVASAELLHPEVGLAAEGDLWLPDQDGPTPFECEVVWYRPDDRDATGRPVVTIGLRFVALEAVEIGRIESLVERFRYSVLVVDDEPANVELIGRILRDEYRVIRAASAAEALAVLEHETVAAIVTDQRMPDTDGLDLLRSLDARVPAPRPSKIVVSAYPQAHELEQFINEGKILHYIEKPFQPEQLLDAVRHAVELHAMAAEQERARVELERSHRHLAGENARLRTGAAALRSMDAIVGQSIAIREIMDTVQQVAPTDATVLVLGETGTGKELIARAIHRLSRRWEEPLLVVNCAALPETLIESELFGHERGAFTGAASRQVGRFERARGGTLFIDEVGDLSPPTQIKLLRVLQEGTFERLGGHATLRADVRIVAATHRDLDQLVSEGRFREDLFYRLHVVPVYVPALRERREDIWPLSLHYLAHFERQMNKEGIQVSDRVRNLLESWAWPGNVRELINIVERLVVLTPSYATVDHVDLPPRARPPSSSMTSPARREGTLREIMERYERQVLVEALRHGGGNRSRVARSLGVTRQTLLGKIKKYKM